MRSEKLCRERIADIPLGKVVCGGNKCVLRDEGIV